jgi:hypothetical protein
MKYISSVLLAVILTGVCVVGCRSTKNSSATTSAHISGQAGTPFDATFWQYGDRFDVSGTLPWTFSGGDVSRLVFRFHSNAVPFSVTASRSTSEGVTKVERNFAGGVCGTTIHFDGELRVLALTK